MCKSDRLKKVSIPVSFKSYYVNHKNNHLIYVCLFLSILIVGCISRVTEISPTETLNVKDIYFETIDQQERAKTSEGYKSKNPTMIVLAKKDEINLLENLVSNDSFSKIQSIDFNEYISIAVFQGVKPTDRYAVTIEKILRNGNNISILVSFHEPSPEISKHDTVTSPYHLIKIKKGDDLKGTFTLKLVVKNNEVVSIQKDIP
jgi:hypothetical protein